MNGPYSIYPVGILSLVFYLFTYLLAKTGMIRFSIHRQLWNVLLLVTFLTTAVLGLILAIQVNYKIKLGITDTLMVWHVDFGIAMAMIAIYHLLWHLDYYLRFFKIRKEKPDDPDKVISVLPGEKSSVTLNKKQLLPVFALGITSMTVQVVMLREFIKVFQGNELVIGTILANWLIITGFGAYLGKSKLHIKDPDSFIFFAIIIASVIPVADVVLLNTLKNVIFPPGMQIGMAGIIFYSAILLLPFCFLSGFLFTYYASLLSARSSSNIISKVYAIEAAGSLSGGFIYSFILVYFLQSLEILSVVIIANIIAAFLFSGSKAKKPANLITSAVLVIFVCSVFLFNLDLRIKKNLFPNQKILSTEDTPYGNLVVTENAGQTNFFSNSILLFSTDNVIGNEETVHYPMLQSESPKKVLLIGGGISGLTSEILKYKVSRIDYVEIDPRVIETGRKFTKSLSDTTVNTVNQDARLFIRRIKQKYDVVIIDLPPPGSLQLNRFYSIEFFRELKKVCNENAVVSLSLPATVNYLSREAQLIQSVIFNTLGEVFTRVRIIPGEKNYFLASDKEPDLDMGKLSVDRGIENTYVNRDYMDFNGTVQRSNYIRENISSLAGINTDLKPLAYYLETGYWMSQFRLSYQLPAILIMILSLLFYFSLNPVSKGLFTAGFSSSAIEILLIFAFQVIYGFVYQAIGIIITVFMAGLAAGAFYRWKRYKDDEIKRFSYGQTAIAGLAAVFPVLIFYMHKFSPPALLVYIVLFLMTLLISFLTGMQFSTASRIRKGSISDITSAIYSVELTGSAAGAFLVSVLLLPLLGLVYVFLLIAAMNLLSAYSARNFSMKAGS
jgi:spermidine synthase